MLQTSPTQLSQPSLNRKRPLWHAAHRFASHRRHTKVPWQPSVGSTTTLETFRKNRQARNRRHPAMQSAEQFKWNMSLRSPRLYEENTLQIPSHALAALLRRKNRVLQYPRNQRSQSPSKPRRSRLSITTSLCQDISLVPLRTTWLSLEPIPPQFPQTQDRQQVVPWPPSILVACLHGAHMGSQWPPQLPQLTPRVV
jgi:hypothetical protein